MTTDDSQGDFDNGWDARATLVDGRWVDRTPRRTEIEPQLRREAAVLPWLAARLRLPVPIPRIVSERPLTLRHALIVGAACPGTSASHGAAVGDFLAQLHAVDSDEAVRRGARDAVTSFTEAQGIRDRMERDVLPRLAADVQAEAAALLRRMARPCDDPRLIHGDLGPEHIRVVDEQVSGVIDWGDSGVSDPALDLAWTVYGSAPEFSEALLAAYGPDDEVLARGRDWHLIGPWHEVLFGLDTAQPDYVESGLAGAAARLRHAS